MQALRFRRVLTGTLHRTTSTRLRTASPVLLPEPALSAIRTLGSLGGFPFFQEGRHFELYKGGDDIPKRNSVEMVATSERICARDLNIREVKTHGLRRVLPALSPSFSGGTVMQKLVPQQASLRAAHPNDWLNDTDFQSRCFCTSNSPPADPQFSTAPPPGKNDLDAQRMAKPMDFVRDVLTQDSFRFTGHGTEQNADFVHINIKRNNTFVTITDSKGNKKFGASMGCVDELKGGQKMTRYVTEATAEHAGRAARSLGLNSIVVRVKGFTYFRKKRQAIMSFKEGYGGRNPIVSIEDTTRRPHNGCRLPKKRRI